MKRKMKWNRTKTALLAAIILILTMIPAAAFADSSVTVNVTVKNETFAQGTNNGKGESPWSGSLISDYPVTLTTGQSMQDAIDKACSEKGVTLNAYPGYIYGVDGLYDGYGNGEPNGGGAAGWITSLNGWFADTGVNNITVGGRAGLELQSGDEIVVAYSCDGGPDVGNDWSITDKSLGKLSFDKGILSPTFKPAEQEYILTVPHGTKLVSLSATPTNPANFITLMSIDNGTSFLRPTTVNVTDGAVIEVYCGSSTDIFDRSIISAGCPSPAAMLASLPSPMTLTILPLESSYPMMFFRVSCFETAAFSSPAMSISTLKWPAFTRIALSFILRMWSTAMVLLQPVAVTKISPKDAASAIVMTS